MDLDRPIHLDRLVRAARAQASQLPMPHRPVSGLGEAAPPDLGEIRARTLSHGVNRPLYLLARAILVPFFAIYLRLQGIGGQDLPRSGPLLLASNHRSFLDPFVIGALLHRPVYYVAKRELFTRRWQAWLLGGLGAFPIDRGRSDHDAIATARAILKRGDCVLIFPEGTRTRPGPLGAPRRGVGRLALETGAPVVPVAVFGTDQVRRGWRVRPRRVRVRFGRTLRFPISVDVSPSLAAGATGRIWECIALQWEWLGGQAAPRRPEAVAVPRNEVALGGQAAPQRPKVVGSRCEPAGARRDLDAALAPMALPKGT